MLREREDTNIFVKIKFWALVISQIKLISQVLPKYLEDLFITRLTVLLEDLGTGSKSPKRSMLNSKLYSQAI